MKTLLLAATILISVPAIGQEVEHAPTVAQCQADQRLWRAKLEGDQGFDLKDVTLNTLAHWEAEMVKCEAVDPPNQSRYFNTDVEAVAAESHREFDFIKRHGLLEQFVKEDAAGQR
jgi:hypothetical protein